MKRKNLIVLVPSVALIVAMVLTGCTGGTASTPTGTQAPVVTPTPQIIEKIVEVGTEKTYKSLNPQGDFIPVQTVALSPRLDTLNGKTVYVVQGEADPVIMPALFALLQKDYPNTTWVFYKPSSSFGESAVDADTKAVAKATIRGIGW